MTSPVYEAKYNTERTIRAVKYGDTTIWENGVRISDDTLAVFKTAHPYIGDAEKNGETLSALKALGKSIKEYGKSEIMLESLKWDYNGK